MGSRRSRSRSSGPSRPGLDAFGEAGDPFDPRIHEALMHSYSEDVDGAGGQAILQVGYQIGDRIVRPARVAVAEPDTRCRFRRSLEPARTPPRSVRTRHLVAETRRPAKQPHLRTAEPKVVRKASHRERRTESSNPRSRDRQPNQDLLAESPRTGEGVHAR